MHRIATVLTALTAGAAALAGPPAAGAQVPPPATPQQLAERFFTELTAKRPVCALLGRPLRDLLVAPDLIGLDPRLPESYVEPNRLRACDAAVKRWNGTFTDPEWDRWLSSRRAGPITVAEERDGVVHLRVPLVRRLQREESRRRYRERVVADAFAVVEDGQWKLAWPGRLWELTPDVHGRPPATLAQLPRYLGAIGRAVAAAEAERRQIAADYVATRVPIEAEPLPFGGRGSRARDPRGDVLTPRRRRVRDQRRATVDVVGVAARIDGGRLTFELRFRGPVPPDLDVDVRLEQVSRGSDSELEISLDDETWASAWREVGLEEITIEGLRGLRVSRVGSVLRASLPWAVAAGQVRADRPFRWHLTAWAAPRAGRPGEAWVDDVPNPGDDLPEGWIGFR